MNKEAPSHTTEATVVTFVHTDGQNAIVRVTEPGQDMREMTIIPMTSFAMILEARDTDEVARLRDELKQAQGIAANRNIAIADLAQENEQLKDRIAQQSGDIKSWRSKFFEMEARAIAAVYLVPEDKVCGELRTLRDRAREVLDTHRKQETT